MVFRQYAVCRIYYYVFVYASLLYGNETAIGRFCAHQTAERKAKAGRGSQYRVIRCDGGQLYDQHEIEWIRGSH